jgi:beta-galactosidase
VRYDVDLPVMSEPQVLAFEEVRDLAWVQVDDERVARLSRSHSERTAAIPPGRRLTVIVEDQGRVNYASRIGEAKGLIGPAQLGGAPLTGWHASTIDLDKVAREIGAQPKPAATDHPVVGPVALVGDFTLDERSDLFLDTSGWIKGFVFINGFHLGRYWSDGPQRSLYIPEPVTKVGINQMIVLELEHTVDPIANFISQPALGHLEE